jgi:hypothetical protein
MAPKPGKCKRVNTPWGKGRIKVSVRITSVEQEENAFQRDEVAFLEQRFLFLHFGAVCLFSAVNLCIEVCKNISYLQVFK